MRNVIDTTYVNENRIIFNRARPASVFANFPSTIDYVVNLKNKKVDDGAFYMDFYHYPNGDRPQDEIDIETYEHTYTDTIHYDSRFFNVMILKGAFVPLITKFLMLDDFARHSDMKKYFCFVGNKYSEADEFNLNVIIKYSKW